jgi:predicted lipoprotein
MKIRDSAPPVFGLMLVVFLTFGSGCTIVRHDDDQKEEDGEISIYFDTGEFDAAVYVDSIWNERVLPRIREQAVEADTLFGMLKEEPDTAIEKYGYRIEITAPFNFMVSGTAKVISVNTESAASTISLDLTGPDGKPVEIQIGPVMKGTAVRDSMDFINFDDFTNQLEFANVSRELNNKIKAVVLNDLDREALQGKMVDFLGAFQWVEGKSILITPVELKPEE